MEYLEPYRQRWCACLGSEADPAQSDAVFRDLVERYGEKHRAYHTIEHVAACLQNLDHVRDQLAGPLEVELALWFHDAIYRTSSNTNEEDSAALAVKELPGLGLSGEMVARVERLVLVTKHPCEPQDEDERYLIDIDLAILGAPEEEYAAFEQNVRREYRWVPRFVYRRERAKVLRSFLERPTVYYTAFFRERLEENARRNLEGAIRSLAG